MDFSINRFICCLLLICTVFVLFSACAVEKENASQIELPEGFTVDNMSEGREFPSANLYSLSYESIPSFDSQMLIISFEFMQGSVIEEGSQRPAYNVPEFSIQLFDNPARLIISFPSLRYLDYERKISVSKPEYTHLSGDFSYDKNGRSILYQFNAPIAYNVDNYENRLTLRIIPIQQPETQEFDYFVTANAFDDYIAGVFEPDMLAPVLTRENSGAILISKPFANESAARSFYDELTTAYPDYSKTFDVIAMYKGQMPIYNADKDSIDISAVYPIAIDDTPHQLTGVLSNGHYICDAPNGSYLFSKRTKRGDSEFFTLHIKTPKGIENIDYEFENIESASYSPDSKMLAVLESASTGSHLYIFAAKTGKLIADLSDSGLGKRISAFIWNEYSTAIFAICGTETVQLKMYDFTMPEGSRTSIVYSGYVEESGLELHNGLLYFVCIDDEGNSTIYNIRPDGGARRPQYSGASFAFSNDGKYLAVTTAGVYMLPNSKNTFSVYDTATKESVLVTDEFDVFEFFWGYDGALYYIQNKQGSTEGEQSESIYEYPYVLYSFDMSTRQSTKLCELKSSAIYASQRFINPLIQYIDDDIMATFELAITP